MLELLVDRAVRRRAIASAVSIAQVGFIERLLDRIRLERILRLGVRLLVVGFLLALLLREQLAPMRGPPFFLLLLLPAVLLVPEAVKLPRVGQGLRYSSRSYP